MSVGFIEVVVFAVGWFVAGAVLSGLAAMRLSVRMVRGHFLRKGMSYEAADRHTAAFFGPWQPFWSSAPRDGDVT